uniref:SMC_N domain-containing protein n=1 Tax=Caenorhabditis japonica TaxID=281687 RepID=A0A8R1I7V5_CAEJA
MQPPHKRSHVSDDVKKSESVPLSTKELTPERRKKLLHTVNIVEPAIEELEPEWTWEGFEYDPNEDLLGVELAGKYEDLAIDPSGSRLIIQTIYVDNFKSYKGKHQLGPLHKNLTMILGPNGSGKSNVIDALLFVFGFKSNKIRTKKLTSLIHSSDDCKYCKVEIHYQIIKDVDEEKYTVIPDSSFKISRSVHRDGSSQYKINDSVSSLKDVQDLLKRAGIDMTHNRFLILQGEVEAIALMKPTVKNTNSGEEGMLEYIEDIVGTNRFLKPIAKLAHRVRLLEMKASRHSVA